EPVVAMVPKRVIARGGYLDHCAINRRDAIIVTPSIRQVWLVAREEMRSPRLRVAEVDHVSISSRDGALAAPQNVQRLTQIVRLTAIGKVTDFVEGPTPTAAGSGGRFRNGVRRD